MQDIEFPLSFKDSLESFTRDLTLAALHDELEPVRCRDAEIERVVTTLLRQSKNNPVLVGEAGVGKTAVVEGLAQRLNSNRAPLPLQNVRILSLSHVDLIAGTSFRGQYEKRLKSIMDAARDNPNVILFIDELHNLIGAGTAIGAPMDAANLLKPALAGGRIRVIGATTGYEYERYIRADAALERRFQPIRVGELGREQTLEVLRARQSRLEIHHLMMITGEAIEAAADLSAEFLPERKQPDRSIDLLDETCARVRLLTNQAPPEDVLALKSKREQLLLEQRRVLGEITSLEKAQGTPLEQFSRGTFKVIETMGLVVEKLITGQTTERPPLPPPDSVQRLKESDPAGRLSELQYELLQVNEELRKKLTEHGFLVTAKDIRATLGHPIALP